MTGWRARAALLLLLAVAQHGRALEVIGITDSTTWNTCDPQSLHIQTDGTAPLPQVTTWKCRFSIGGETVESAVIAVEDDTVLCSPLVEIPIGDYSYALVDGSNNVYPGPETLTVTGVIDATHSQLIPRLAFSAGDPIVVEITPMTECDVLVPACANGGTGFDITVDGVTPAPEVTFVGLSETEDCEYTLAMTAAGTYDYSITLGGDVVATSTFTINAGAVSHSDSSVDEAALASLTAGEEVCFDITVRDRFLNPITGLLASNFEVEWRQPTGVVSVSGEYIASSSNGVYNLCFVPNVAGAQNLTVLVQGGVITDPPLLVTVTAGPFDADRSQLADYQRCLTLPSLQCSLDPSVNGLTAALAGVEAEFVILSRDSYGSIKTDSSDVDLQLMNVTLVQDGVAPITATVQAGTDGSYLRVLFTATVKGVYIVYASYDGEGLNSGLVLTVPVLGGPVSFADSPFSTTQALSVVAGTVVTSYVTAKDAYGNLIDEDPLWTAQLVGTPNVPCTVAETSPAVYAATCRSNTTGVFAVRYYHDGVIHPQSRSVNVSNAAISGPMSTFDDFPSKLTAGQSASITIHAYDLYGNPGGTALSYQVFRTTLSPSKPGTPRPNIPEATIVSGNVYRTEFTVTSADTYEVSVAFVGQPLQALQNTTMVVEPDVTSGPDCTIQLIGSAVIGSPVVYQLRARDQYRNQQIYNEIERFELVATLMRDSAVTVTAALATTATVGVYTATFDIKVAGDYTLLGFVDGQASFTDQVLVVPGEPTTGKTTFAPTSEGHALSQAGVKSYIKIQSRDVDGNPIEYAQDFNVTIEGTTRRRDTFVIECTKETGDDFLTETMLGISVYSYTLTTAGSFTLNVRLNGEHITGSPSPLVIKPAPAVLAGAKVTGPATIMVDETVTFTLELYDEFDNRVTGDDEVSAMLVGNGVAAALQATPVYVASTRAYSISFKPTIGALYNLTVTINALVLTGTQVGVLTPYGGECNDFEAAINQNQEWTLTCIAYDKYGQPRLKGGDKLEVTVTSGSFTTKDLQDGRYTITYSSPHIGRHDVTIGFNGKPCVGMPLHPIIIPGAVVLGTVIPAIFIAGVLVVAGVMYMRRRKQKREALLRKKRKPEQVFPANDFEEEWSDEGEAMDQEEEWFIDRDNLTLEDKKMHAHEMAMRELQP